MSIGGLTRLPCQPGSPVTAAAGCDGIYLHHLRHFYASGLIAAGCDVVTVHPPWSLQRIDHAERPLALVAVSRGPDPAGSGRDGGRGAKSCELSAD